MPLGIEQFTRAVTKRARRGLYAGRRVLAGNNISEDGGNKTRRVWKPNAQNKRLYSEVLDRMVRLRVTTAALRNIDKAGGLDNYILSTPDHKLQSDVGAALREQMLAQLAREAAQKRQRAPSFAAQALAQQAPTSSTAAAEGEITQQQQQQQQQQQPVAGR